MIQSYFTIQLRRSNRALKEFGVSPALAYPILATVFIIFSLLLFSRTTWAAYLYVLTAISLLHSLGGKQRNDFLLNCFTIETYRKIRWIENFLFSLPFLLFLCFKSHWILCITLFAVAFVMTKFRLNIFSQRVIPTPFSKKPFEFSRGFRKNIVFLLLSYFLCIMSIVYRNPNLGLFTLVLVFTLCIGFYNDLEDPFYIWNFNFNPAGFLKYKVQNALKNASWLSLPICIVLLIFFKEIGYLLLIFEIWGLGLLVTALFAKYSRYPGTISILELLLLGVCLIAPPMMLLIVPYFYKNSKQKLEVLLK